MLPRTKATATRRGSDERPAERARRGWTRARVRRCRVRRCLVTLHRVDDLPNPPVVGEFYLVPCILIPAALQRKGQLCGGMRPRWWPILGPRHQDLDLGVPAYHYHYDPRFMTDRAIVNRIGSQPISWLFGAILCDGHPSVLPSPVPRRRRCLRHMPAHFADVEGGWGLPSWLRPLEAKFADVLLPDCKVCPHRGLPLAQLPQKNGIVTCRGHGLRWDVATGKLVRRPLGEKEDAQ